MRFLANIIVTINVQLQDKLEQLGFMRRVRQIIETVQHCDYIESIPDAQWEFCEGVQYKTINIVAAYISSMLQIIVHIVVKNGLFLVTLGIIVFLAIEILK